MKKSFAATLPPDVRADLDRELIQRGFAGYAAIAQWLSARGYAISKSAVHRHGAALERRIERIRAASEQAQVLVDAVGDDGGALADASMRAIQQRIHDVLVAADDGEEQPDLRALASTAKALAETSRASALLRAERRKVLAAAAEVASATASGAGVSEEVEQAIRRAIEGAA